MIPDTNAKKPDDWDDSMDGEWEPPLLTNPLCESAPGCGAWTPPLIDNPEFKGWFNCYSLFYIKIACCNKNDIIYFFILR